MGEADTEDLTQAVRGSDYAGVSHTLFAVLPSKETFTLRGLSSSVSSRELRARLELVVGVPSEAWQLHYGGTLLDEQHAQLQFGDKLRDCALLRLSWREEHGAVCQAVTDRDWDLLKELLLYSRQESEDTGSQTSSLTDSQQDGTRGNTDSTDQHHQAFIAAFMAAQRGLKDVIQLVEQIAPHGLVDRSEFGRTLVHAAASSDQTVMLEMLAIARCPLQTRDVMGKTPSDVANQHKAYSSERTLRNLHIKSRSKLDRRNCEVKINGGLLSNYLRNSKCSHYRDATHNPTSPRSQAASDRASTEGSLSVRTNRSYQLCQRTSNLAVTNENFASAVKRPQRCRSAPSKVQKHRHCHQIPPFVAYRMVPEEELKPVTVEYVAMTQPTDCNENSRLPARSPGGALKPCPGVPYTSPCSSVENIPHSYHAEYTSGRRSTQEKSVSWYDDNKQQSFKKETRGEHEGSLDETTSSVAESPRDGFPKGRVLQSKPRVKSATYYRTKYHREAAEDHTIPKPRPATAGARFREWKTWLLEKYKDDAKKAKSEEERRQQKFQNLKAFELWLAKKRAQGELYPGVESDDSQDEDRRRMYRRTPHRTEDSQAYKEWLEKKKETFASMDRRRKESLHQGGDGRKDCSEKRVTIFEMGDTNPGDMKEDNPAGYLRAYQHWQEKREKYEKYKQRKGLADSTSEERNNGEAQKARKALVLAGMTYEEWLGQKRREGPPQNNTTHPQHRPR